MVPKVELSNLLTPFGLPSLLCGASAESAALDVGGYLLEIRALASGSAYLLSGVFFRARERLNGSASVVAASLMGFFPVE